MGAASSRAKITCEEGQILLKLASNFVLPEKLDEKKFDIAQRAHAGDAARTLWRELRALSPKYVKERKLFFGPADNWKQVDGRIEAICAKCGSRDVTMPTTELEDRDRLVEIRIDEKIRSGAYWCLLIAIHPVSQVILGTGIQAEILWPLAEKLRISNALKKAIGIYGTQGMKIELDTDPDSGKDVEDEPVIDDELVEPKLDPA